jgi:hypothetical protein
MDISNPSRLNFSISIPRCRSPLPLTAISLLLLMLTYKETSFSASLKSRLTSCSLLVIVPSCPERGEELTFIVMLIIGGSMAMVGMGRSLPFSLRV